MTKKRLGFVIKFLVSGGLLWALFRDIDLIQTKDLMLNAAPGLVLAAVLVLLVQIVISVFRWRAVLAAIETPLTFLKGLQIFYIGIFFNQALPSSVGGDFVRMYRTYKTGIHLSGAINGVMLERVATVAALAVLVLATQPFFLPRVEGDAAAWIAPAAGLLFFAAVAGVGFLMILDRLPPSLRRWRLVRGLAMLAGDTRKVFLAPRHAGRAMGWSLVGHVNLTFAVFVLSMALALDVTMIDCMALIPPVILITTIPISIGGWGVREQAMVIAFGLIGVPKESATALSILLGLIAMATALPGGALWLTSGGERGEVKAAEEMADGLAGESKDSAGG